MSILIWGMRDQSVDLGLPETRTCPICERERPFRTVLEYRLHHLYYVFGFVSNRRVLRRCDLCSHGDVLDPGTLPAGLVEGRVPFFHRYGCLVAVAGLAALILLGVLISVFGEEPRNIPRLLERARQGDATAVARLEKEAAAGDVPSQEALVALYTTGQGVAASPEKALRWATRAAELGSAWAAFELGIRYRDGRGVPIDLVEARRWFERADALGDINAANELGSLIAAGGGGGEDQEKAFALFERGARAGDPAAMVNLGLRTLHGLGTAADPAAAARWLEKVASASDPSSVEPQVLALARRELGRLYEKGLGVGRDTVRALDLYRQASAVDEEAAREVARLEAKLAAE